MFELIATDPETKHILLIGALRSTAKPALQTLIDSINQAGNLTVIDLQPLPPEAVVQLVADALRFDIYAVILDTGMCLFVGSLRQRRKSVNWACYYH